MQVILDFLIKTAAQVLGTLAQNWYFLVLSALIAALLKLYVDETLVARFLRRNQAAGVVTATAAAVGTLLCSCGTTAVILGMMASMTPWAPIVAFMVASPLTSPEELIYSAGLFGWRFAAAFFFASILLGLAGGLVAAILDARGWLAGQSRFQPTIGGSGPELPLPNKPRITWGIAAREVWVTGKRLLVFFIGFAFVGYALNNLIPGQWITAFFGAGSATSVPLAATLGLPRYVNTEASLPLLRGLMDAGMSQGAGLAFLITGAGTSIGAIAGALTIARWRIIGLVLGTLWVGAVLFGLAFDAWAVLLPF